MADPNAVKRKRSEEEVEGDGDSEEFCCHLLKRPKSGLSEGGETSSTSSEGSDLASIHSLPNEMLECVFSFLGIKDRIRTELVCSRWRWIGQNVSWKWPRELVLRFGHAAIPQEVDQTPRSTCDHVLPSLLSRCGMNLVKLILVRENTLYWLSDCLVDAVLHNCPNLQELTLINMSLSENVQLLAEGCSKLKTITLRKYEVISSKDMQRIICRCQSLQELNVFATINLMTGENFSQISKKLKALKLDNSSVLTGDALQMLTTRCDNILDLRLTGCGSIAQDELRKVLCHYKNTLKCLFLDDWKQKVDWTKALLELTNLEQLSLCRCYLVNDKLCRMLARNCLRLNLLYVDATAITDAGLSALASLPRLLFLGIECLSLSGAGISDLASQGRLREVYAKRVRNLKNPDECFSDLARRCPYLQLLDVSYIKQISNHLVEAFRIAVSSNPWRKRVKLGVKCTSVTYWDTCEKLKVLTSDVQSLFEQDRDFESENKTKRGEKFYVVDDLYQNALYAN